jgi:hypothetical protein
MECVSFMYVSLAEVLNFIQFICEREITGRFHSRKEAQECPSGPYSTKFTCTIPRILDFRR